jgi:acyl-CoA thioesterase-1
MQAFLAMLGLLLSVMIVLGAEETSASPELATLRDRMTEKAPLVWVITGDSITQGAKWVGPERPYPSIIEEHIRWTLGRRRDFFINTGISGERATGLLADFDWRVLRFRPDVVSIMIGMNDATAGRDGRTAFAANLREMVRRVRAAGAIPLLHRTNTILLESPDALQRADLPAYNGVIAEVARELNVILVDHWKHWQSAKPTPAALRAWLAQSIHPNGAGHRQFAIEFFRTIGCYDPAAPACQP